MNHEGELLSDALIAEMQGDIDSDNYNSIQDKIDSFIIQRTQNDIEINVVQLIDITSAMVIASNNSGNIAFSSDDELQQMLKTLQENSTTIVIKQSDPAQLSKTDIALNSNPSQPDHYIQSNYRSLIIDVPLYSNSKDWGTLNIVMSLKYLDQKQRSIFIFLITTLILSLCLIALGLGVISNIKLFEPLRLLGESMLKFAENTQYKLPYVKKTNNEIDYIYNAFILMSVQLKESEAINIEYQSHLEDLVNDRTTELLATQNATIVCMAALAEMRDHETGAHILRVQNYVKVISNALFESMYYSDELNESFIDLLYQSAPLHDVGKVGIEDKILLKPGKLTEQEFNEMKKHTLLGKKVLKAAEKSLGKNTFLDLAQEISISHHEKWDGSGYPHGLNKYDIPLSGRIMAVADVYDALISKRVYKPAFDHKSALDIIIKDSGKHFDPQIVDAFVSIEKEINKIASEFKE
ncbi:MAG: HD domain-containing phosphohydrolase [Acidaminobacteraceae bacterium]